MKSGSKRAVHDMVLVTLGLSSGELSARPAHQTTTHWRQPAFPLFVLRRTKEVEQGSAPEAIPAGHSIAQRGRARRVMTGARQWTPVERDLVAVLARHVQNRPSVEHVEEKWLL